MKKFICIIFAILMFGITNYSYAETKDTCKYQPIKTDLKPQIINKLLECFIKTDFLDLVIFCEGYVEFGFVKDSVVYDDSGTEYKAMSNLNDFFKGLDYSRFKIMSGINLKGEDVLVVKVFLYENSDNYFFNVYFTLDKRQAIYSVIIII